MKTRVGALLRALGITLLVVGVAAVPAIAEEEASAPDFSSDASVRQYLLSLGLNPDEVLIQRGLLNYAGDVCPGIGWTCGPSDGPVVQVSQGGVNVFEQSESAASAESLEQTTTTNPCTILQSNTSGANSATCDQDTTVNGDEQFARIEQHNTSGSNTATIDQDGAVAETVTIGVSAAFDQTLKQEGTIYQRNDSGANAATLSQALTLSTEARSVSSATSLQDGVSLAVLKQTSKDGDQTATIDQDETMTSSFFDIVGNTEQRQQTRATERNISAFLSQSSTGGHNEADLFQDQPLTMTADEIVGQVIEIQGNQHGGMVGHVEQSATNDTSHYDAKITKSMTMDDDAQTALQFEDPECCDIIGTSLSTPTSCTISETVTLVGPDNAVQNAHARGRSFAQVNCVVDLVVTLNRGGDTSNSPPPVHREGTFVDVTIDCQNGVCTTSDGDPEQPETTGNLHLAIRNVTRGEPFSTTNAAGPYFTSANRNDVLELKIEFHNHTPKPISEITLYSTVPAGTAFVSCKACTDGMPSTSGVITFNRGIGDPNGKRVGTFRVRVGDRPGEGSVYSHFATATTKISTLRSNDVYYVYDFN